jgi:hypothetical protein
VIVRAFLTALAGLAALYAVSTVWRQNERAAGLDFYIYFVAGQLAGRADVDNIYSAETQQRLGDEYYARAQQTQSELRKYDAQRRRRLDLVSSPFLYTTLRWVSRDYDRALTQYHVFVLACFIGGVLLCCRSVGLSWAVSLLLLAGLLLAYRGFEADLRVGNVNSIQLAAIGVFLWIERRARLALEGGGREQPPLHWLILGALVAFKPNLMFVPLLLLVARLARREYGRALREMALGAAGGIAAFLVASISYGSPRVWVQWVSAANEFYHRLPGRMERNITPALPWFHSYGEWISYALAALLLVVVCAAIWRAKTNDAPLVVGLGILIYLLSANVVWLHYLVLVVPIAVALLRWRTTAAVAVVALLLLAEEPFEKLTRQAAAPIEPWLITPALLALLLCGVVKLLDRHPAPALRG